MATRAPLVVAPPTFILPPALVAAGFAVRREVQADTAFLKRLYASTRESEIAQVTDWSDEQRDAFLAQQFQAQRRHYYAEFADSAFLVIERDGAPVGRLYLERRGDTLHILDIALLPEARGHGTGTALLEAVIAQAAEMHCGVGIFVERFNPASRLYQRLGFVEINDVGVYLELRRARPLETSDDA
jgi:GNAT superfamily N-acetyltransferase